MNAAVLADFNRDGRSEIALGNGGLSSCDADPSTCKGRFYVFDWNGGSYNNPGLAGGSFTNAGYPSSYSGQNDYPTFADFDHDGVAELAARFSDGVYVWDREGTPHALSQSSKVGRGVHFAPIKKDGSLNDGTLRSVGGPVFDIEGDGFYEELTQTDEGIALSVRGKLADGYPIALPGGSPVIADMNRDGSLDMLWLSENSVQCYSLGEKTFTETSILTRGGASTVGAPNIYPTFQHDPYEPNQPATAVDPKTASNPAVDFRAFSPWGMRDSYKSGAGNLHSVTAELGEKGDEDWYFIANASSAIEVFPHVPSRTNVVLDVYQYAPAGNGWAYSCQASGSSLNFHSSVATGDCPVGVSTAHTERFAAIRRRHASECAVRALKK